MMYAATEVTTRHSASDDTLSVEWWAAEDCYSRRFLDTRGGRERARRFACSLQTGAVKVNDYGKLRYRSYGRSGEELYVSIPA